MTFDLLSFMAGLFVMDVIAWQAEYWRSRSLAKEKIWFEKREYSRK